MRKYNTIFFLIILSLSSCIIFSQNGFEKTRIKKIKLQDIKKDTLLLYENNKVVILFSKSQTIEILEKELSKRKNKIEDRNSCINFIKDLKTNTKRINIKSLSTSNESLANNIKYSLIFENWLLERMLIKGNAIIFDKKNSEYIDYVILKKLKDKMNSSRECFLLPDNTEFFVSYIILGE